MSTAADKVTSETPPLFGKTRFLQGLIDEFIDKITEGTIYMEMGVKAYLEAGKASAACEEKLMQIVDTKEHPNYPARSAQGRLAA